MDKIYFKTCKQCGKEFETESKNKTFCDICVKNRQLERWRKKNALYKKKKPNAKKPTIKQVIKAMDKYNKIHNTNYSYGYFVYLLENEKVQI